MNRITHADIQEFDDNQSLNRYQTIAIKSAVYPGKHTPRGMEYAALAINGEAGEIAEHVKKAMRDEAFGEPVILYSGPQLRDAFIAYPAELTPERRELIEKEIGDCLWYLSALCNELGVTLFAMARKNLVKLMGRTERGTLQGSGDGR